MLTISKVISTLFNHRIHPVYIKNRILLTLQEKHSKEVDICYSPRLIHENRRVNESPLLAAIPDLNVLKQQQQQLR